MQLRLIAVIVFSLLHVPHVMAELPVRKVEFTETKAPTSIAQQQRVYTESSAIVTYADGRKISYPLVHHILYNSGEQIGSWRAGSIVDRNGHILQTAQINEAGDTAQGPFHARSPDTNSLMRQGDNLFLITHLEYATVSPNVDPGKPILNLYGSLPMVMNQASIQQESLTGRLTAFNLKNVDMSGVGGSMDPLCRRAHTMEYAYRGRRV